jgi:hypothetical protein
MAFARRNLFISVTGRRGIAVNAIGGLVCLDVIQDPDPDGTQHRIIDPVGSASLTLEEANDFAREILFQVREALVKEVGDAGG